MDWRHFALCRGIDPETFFPVDERPESAGVLVAKDVCALCPVRDECLAFALESGEDAGVWGGLAPSERRALHRRAA